MLPGKSWNLCSPTKLHNLNSYPCTGHIFFEKNENAILLNTTNSLQFCFKVTASFFLSALLKNFREERKKHCTPTKNPYGISGSGNALLPFSPRPHTTSIAPYPSWSKKKEEWQIQVGQWRHYCSQQYFWMRMCNSVVSRTYPHI